MKHFFQIAGQVARLLAVVHVFYGDRKSQAFKGVEVIDDIGVEDDQLRLEFAGDPFQTIQGLGGFFIVSISNSPFRRGVDGDKAIVGDGPFDRCQFFLGQSEEASFRAVKAHLDRLGFQLRIQLREKLYLFQSREKEVFKRSGGETDHHKGSLTPPCGSGLTQLSWV